MPAETVPLVLDIYDGAQDLAGTGHVILVPSSAVNDTVNHQAIMVPLNVDLIGTETNGGLPLTVHLRPTDDPDITPSGWAWTATFWNVPGVTNGSVQVFALPYNGGATSYLSSVITVQNPVTYQAYMPLPQNTPADGSVPTVMSVSPLVVQWQASAGADKNYTQSFSAAGTVSVAHNLGKYPAVTVFDSAGDQCEGSVDYTDLNNLIVSFSAPFSGTVTCN